MSIFMTLPYICAEGNLWKVNFLLVRQKYFFKEEKIKEPFIENFTRDIYYKYFPSDLEKIFLFKHIY